MKEYIRPLLTLSFVTIFFACKFTAKPQSDFTMSPKTVSFSAIVVGETPFVRQAFHITDSLVIDTLRTIQIVDDAIFVEKLDMDWYIFRIDHIAYQGDSLIVFTIDKEANYSDYEKKNPLRWTEIQSEYWYSSVIIQKNKENNLWNLKYDDRLQDLTLIKNKEIPLSGFPILLYEWDDE
jgi:hypothetical protein